MSFGRSLVKGMKSGAPGRYFRSGSGTWKPYRDVSSGSMTGAKVKVKNIHLQSGSFPASNTGLSQLHKV